MQPVLDGMSHLTMASLVGTDKQVRYACERDTDCSGARKFCVHESDHRWVGVCSLHRASDQDHGVVVLSIVIVLVVLLATITAVVFIPAS